jgi:hypothetical protein
MQWETFNQEVPVLRLSSVWCMLWFSMTGLLTARNHCCPCLQIEVERIVLHAIRSKSYVTTFRTRRMSPEMLAELEQVKQVCGGLASRCALFSNSITGPKTAHT